ncbi:MAG: OmpA family protein, partial [Flavobacteriales bacterium]|nr:OmpA family protein [Flavobacteriales bacterium]
ILSENRAKSVRDYLVEKGIDVTRLSIKGYGDTKPIADNSTEKGRAENRRSEFKIVSK